MAPRAHPMIWQQFSFQRAGPARRVRSLVEPDPFRALAGVCPSPRIADDPEHIQGPGADSGGQENGGEYLKSHYRRFTGGGRAGSDEYPGPTVARGEFIDVDTVVKGCGLTLDRWL
jgi:hypothetical protein